MTDENNGVDLTKYQSMDRDALIDALRLRDTQNAMQGEQIENLRRVNGNQATIIEQNAVVAAERDALQEQIDLFARQKADDEQRITDLIREKTAVECDLEDAKRATQQAQIRHENDIATIGEALLEEAERRGWCSDFDEFVSDVNEKLYASLPRRIKDFDVYVEVIARVRVSVSAADEDEARSEAYGSWRERWDGEFAAEAISNGSVLDDYSSWDVEEID